MNEKQKEKSSVYGRMAKKNTFLANSTTLVIDESASWYSLLAPTPTFDNSDYPIMKDEASEPKMILEENEEDSVL